MTSDTSPSWHHGCREVTSQPSKQRLLEQHDLQAHEEAGQRGARRQTGRAPGTEDTRRQAARQGRGRPQTGRAPGTGAGRPAAALTGLTAAARRRETSLQGCAAQPDVVRTGPAGRGPGLQDLQRPLRGHSDGPVCETR